MWPWLVMLLGAVLVVGGLVARQRLMRASDPQRSAPSAVRPGQARPAAAHTPAPATPSRLAFADLPDSHRLTGPPMLRVRSSEVPLLDWLRHDAEGNAWSGVVTSVADRISGDARLAPYVESMDRATLQRHAMSTLMMLTGEGVTVGAVRRWEQVHLAVIAAGGPPVTEEVWDRLAATVADALREHGVRESAVAALDETTAPLRAVIVTPRGPRTGSG